MNLNLDDSFKVRVSIGSAIVLELINGKIDAAPTTIYLLTYHDGKCTANCGFCPQARESQGKANMLSRVVWPAFPLKEVLNRIPQAVNSRKIHRICIQTLNYPNFFQEVKKIVKSILSRIKVPISVSCQPLNREMLKELSLLGVNRVSIALDAATKEIFEKVKGSAIQGPYRWEKHIEALLTAVEVFGRNNITTHLIVGLGETEKEMISRIQWCVDNGIYPAMFAFTPIRGTKLENMPQPSLDSYRRIQLAHFLITNKLSNYRKMVFNQKDEVVNFGVSKAMLKEVIESGTPFLTSGCPSCNRPYYNEKPSGPIYNYPRPLTTKEIKEIANQILKGFRNEDE